MKKAIPVIIIILIGLLGSKFFMVKNEYGEYVDASLYQMIIWRVQADNTDEGADNHSQVFVAEGGSIYHYNNQCSNMKHFVRMELGEARERHYKPCENCVTYERP
jgi:hypothetical protein